MKYTFNELGISQPILKALEKMGYKTPTEVQAKAIPRILNKEDLIVMSKTGSGKTAVFGVSILQMTDAGAAEPQGLILTPTRELAVQVDSDLKHMSEYLPHRTTVVYGQHNMNVEIQSLKKDISIVTGTPGRIYDHIRHGNLETKHIRFLVLDEADRMLDMGFLEQVVKIIRTLRKDRVTLLFSATMPAEIRNISREFMKHPTIVEIESQTKTVETTKQVYCRMNNSEKNVQLNRFLLIEQPESCMIFCNTRISVDKVQRFLSDKGYVAHALHGDIPQGKRTKTIQLFKQGEFHLLVATDVAARGIHIDGLSLVINYDVPLDRDSYVHRIGRTGRAGKDGSAITFVTEQDIMSLYEIEEHIGSIIPEVDLPSEAVYNENRASAQKWALANSSRSTARSHPKPEPKSAHRNNTPSKTSPQHTRHREHPDSVNTNNKPGSSHSTSRVKPVHTNTNPVQRRSESANAVQAQARTEIIQNQNSSGKKPFFRRMLQRILGK